MVDTKPIPTAEEMLPIVRNRLHALEEAVEAFLTVMKETGEKREVAYGATVYRRAPSYPLPNTLRNFFTVYEETVPERLAAFEKLHEAMQMDFETALICAPDTTDEHLQTWLTRVRPPNE